MVSLGSPYTLTNIPPALPSPSPPPWSRNSLCHCCYAVIDLFLGLHPIVVSLLPGLDLVCDFHVPHKSINVLSQQAQLYS